MLLVSHDPRMIREFCTRALLIEAGRVILDGSAATVVDEYMKLLTEAPAVPA